MSAQYRFYLDGTLVSNPIGWDGWEGEVRRDAGKRGIVSEEKGQFTFTNDGFTLIRNARKNGYCSTMEVLIEESCGMNDSWKVAFEGLIFISDAVFNLTKKQVTVELEDDSFFSRINNNMQVEASINAGKTKNGAAIPAMDIWHILMFNPCDGSTLPGREVPAYRMHDVGSYLINFMTDGLVGWRSTVLDIGGEFEGVFMNKGGMIRDVTTTDVGVLLKFIDYIRNASNMCDLSFKIDYSTGMPVFVLERTADTFTNATRFTFDNVREIIQQIDQARNFAAVELGTDDIIESFGCGTMGGMEPAFPDQINLLGCKREQYAVTGTCNIDSVKDITIDWVLSSNVIENIFMNGDDRYDGNVCIIDCDSLDEGALTASAIQGDVFGTTPPVFYNARFFNYQVALRHLRGIPNTLVKYLNQPDVGFIAQYTTTETVTTPPTVVTGSTVTFYPFPFGDDYTAPGFDTNNDFGNGTVQGVLITQANSSFESPFDNVYRFRVSMDISAPNGYQTTVTWHLCDPAFTILNSYPVTKSDVAGTYSGVQFDSPPIYVVAGNKVRVEITWEFTASPALPVKWELLSTGTQGGEYVVVNQEDYIADTYKITVPMTRSQWWELKTNATEKIDFNDAQGNQGSGWIEYAKYSFKKGEAELTLISS